MNTIRTRLLLTLLVGLTAVLAAGGVAVFLIAESKLTGQFDEGLQSRAHALASLVKLEPGGLVFEISDAPPELLEETAFELRTQAGRLLKRSRNLGEFALPRRDVAEDGFVLADASLPGEIDGRVVWHAFRPRLDPDDWEGRDAAAAPPPAPGVLVVVAALDRGPLDRALSTLLGTLLGVGAGVAVTAALLVAAGVRWGLAPLDRLRGQLGTVSDQTLSRRLDDAGAPRELLPVYGEINRMLDRVEATLERERSFAGAAAHELRTPLAELRAVVEVALRWPEAERSHVALKEALAIGGEMERLIHSLLLISRGHRASMQPPLEAPPIAAIVAECIQHADDLIARKQLTINVQTSKSLNVETESSSEARADVDVWRLQIPHGWVPGRLDVCPVSRDAIEIIVRNLIDNAIHYTPLRGSIFITDGQSNGGVPGGPAPILIIENGPVDLTEADLVRLFEPFWRMERSRSDRQHVGLGLTVVKRIAEASGLDIEARLVGGRLQMTLGSRAQARQ